MQKYKSKRSGVGGRAEGEVIVFGPISGGEKIEIEDGQGTWICCCIKIDRCNIIAYVTSDGMPPERAQDRRA